MHVASLITMLYVTLYFWCMYSYMFCIYLWFNSVYMAMSMIFLNSELYQSKGLVVPQKKCTY